MSKYDPLTAKLRELPYREWRTTFKDLERTLGFRLPRAARSYRAWWSNNPSNNVMTKAWLKAGWQTEQVDMAGETLIFKKVRPGAGNAKPERPPLFGALAGTVHIASGTNLIAPTGESWNADRG